MKKEEELQWLWNKRKIPLSKLHDNQLISIKHCLKKSTNKVWFGTNAEVWEENINNLIEKRRINDENRIVNSLLNLRINRATHNANIINNGILKCFARKNETKTTIKSN